MGGWDESGRRSRRGTGRAARTARAGSAILAGAAALLLFGAAGFGQSKQGATIRVEIDKAEVVTLNGSASVVMIANPAIADVVVERNHLMFILGKQPGETRLYVYNGSGKLVLQREVVVVPHDDRTVSVTRVAPDKIDLSNYSCDPNCVVTTETSSAASGASSASGGGAGTGGGAAPVAGATPAPGATPPAAGGTPQAPAAGGTGGAPAGSVTTPPRTY